MLIANQIFTDDRTVVPYKERVINEQSQCVLDYADMIMVEKLVHDFAFEISSPIGGAIFNVITFASQGIVMSDGYDYKIRATIYVPSGGTNPYPSSVDLEVRPHNLRYFKYPLAMVTGATYEQQFSSINAPFNASVELLTQGGILGAYDIGVKIEVIQLVPETRKYIGCDGVAVYFEQSYESLIQLRQTYDVFGDETSVDDVYIYRSYTATGSTNIPACKSSEKYNEALIICDHSVNQNYRIEPSLGEIIPINIEIISFGSSNLTDQADVFDITSNINTTFTEFKKPGPINYANYMALMKGAYTISLYYYSAPIIMLFEVALRLRYNTALVTCGCPCEICEEDELLWVYWTDSCGDVVSTRIEGQVKGGVYIIEGDSYTTYKGTEVYPLLNTQAEYKLVINKYSDSVFQGILYLVSNNEIITINGVEYRIKVDNMSPSWDIYNQYGILELTIIKVETIKTVKRKCC
jgi:hypothetical protein